MDFIKIQNEDEKIYTIENNINNKYIINFLARNNLLISVTNDKITFGVDTLVSLKEPLDDNIVKNFIYDIGSQIFDLKDENIAIKYFSITDIVVINSDIFLFINPTKLFTLLSKKNINPERIDRTIKSYEYGLIDSVLINKDDRFLPPELREKNLEKNSYVYYTSSFYSLAKLILFIFDIQIEDIDYTSLSFFLKRCLENKPEDRIFLFI